MPAKVEPVPGSDHSMEYWSRVELSDSYDRGDRGTSSPRTAVGELIYAVPGVQAFFMNGYSLRVYRSPAFAWDEITPKIVEILDGLEIQ